MIRIDRTANARQWKCAYKGDRAHLLFWACVFAAFFLIIIALDIYWQMPVK